MLPRMRVGMIRGPGGRRQVYFWVVCALFTAEQLKFCSNVPSETREVGCGWAREVLGRDAVVETQSQEIESFLWDMGLSIAQEMTCAVRWLLQ